MYNPNSPVVKFLNARYVTKSGHPNAWAINNDIIEHFSPSFEKYRGWKLIDIAIETFREYVEWQMELESPDKDKKIKVTTEDIVDFLDSFPIEHSWRKEETLVPAMIYAIDLLYYA